MITVVVDYDPVSRQWVTLHGFLDTEQKEAEACLKDLVRSHPEREIVLLRAATWKELQCSNRRYFPRYRTR